MEHGMVTGGGGWPPLAAAGMYILFGVVVIAVVLYLQSRGHEEHEPEQ